MKRVNFAINKEDCFTIVKKALIESGFSIDKEVQSEIIKASIGTSLVSWGEEITIIISQNKDICEIEIESKCKAQLFSWGKNKENEEKINKAIINLFNNNSEAVRNK